MADFVQTLIAAIAVGSLYALVALGYTLVYGVLKFINFAHSDIFVLGTWTSLTAAVVITNKMGIEPEHAPWWVAMCVFLLAIAMCATFGYCIERFAYRPLRGAPRLNVLITAIGVSLLLQNVGQLPGKTVAESGGSPAATIPFGAIPRNMPALIEDRVLNETSVAEGTMAGGSKRGTVKLDQNLTIEAERQYRIEYVKPPAADAPAGAQSSIETLNVVVAEPGTIAAGEEISTQPRRNAKDVEGTKYRVLRSPLVPIRLIDVLIVTGSIGLMIGLQILVFKTKLGRAMRAVSHSVETASLMGINTNAVISFTFVLGSALAAAAAFLYPLKYPLVNQTAHGIWVLLGLKAFVAAVVGGIGNVRGAVLGGFLIALIEFFGSRYVSTELRDVYVFGLLILVLLLRPSGLLGSTAREKV
ncbi:MAG: branched-chain amino acid ABC transporter permease [Planctomycetes bacterium]|nr:branched-chain amino acid ABC transporter permease [Planctomycetota bacterium]